MNTRYFLSPLRFVPIKKNQIHQRFRQFHVQRTIMANSKFEYVRAFENEDKLLPNCWAIARIDGRTFHKFATKHSWDRPNDHRALELMNKAAKVVMREFGADIIIAYGQSDEFSFVFRRQTEIFERRNSKIITTLVSKFSAAFVFHWSSFFPETPLLYPPSFDGRIVLYPTDQNMRDYLSWRQADCHINNLYNTVFWNLVLKGGLSNNAAEKRLLGTLASDKNEILFSEFGINYNNEPEICKKGTVLVGRPKRKVRGESEAVSLQKYDKEFSDDFVTQLHCDIIGDKFWLEYPYLLAS